MKYIPFSNEQSLSAFAPLWRFCIAEKFISGIDCNRLKTYLLSKKPEILAIKENVGDGGTGLGNDSTTARFRSYNIMDWDQPDINTLEEEIIIMHDRYYRDMINTTPPKIECNGWMNIMKKGERVRRHNHGYLSNSYISGNFTVCCDNTKTVYTNPYEHWDEDELIIRVDEWGVDYDYSLYASKNTEGQLTLFPSYVPHFTTQHISDTDRITLAFEIRPNYETNRV